ncbi:hypothetical protein K4749_11795 [Streptomyces sp. TRM72054]|uniref:hypothetical protein n=1 Tax=Streptomyces sp. TRM72054 TaxID=2870562 RepID=UPI001C8BB3E0|nr:hypothetical protein [Streptomyces sp. TRM72054]MBX9394263.1 hypothetical protein [Streptomyces sp. TRM72054]
MRRETLEEAQLVANACADTPGPGGGVREESAAAVAEEPAAAARGVLGGRPAPAQ